MAEIGGSDATSGMSASVDISRFEHDQVLFDPITVWLVVKSQDQAERRARIVEKLRRGEKIGRMEPRPIAEGLLLKCRLPPEGGRRLDADGALSVTRFREPRHVFSRSKDRFLLTEIGRVDLIDGGGAILDTFTHPYFAFLHSVVLDRRQEHMLVTSSGYDAILELDVRTKQESWRWFGWDHGFNPNDEGVYYSNSPEKAEDLRAQGYVAQYIDPDDYSEQGLLTATRTTHPNVALYNPYTSESTVVASLGYGQIAEIDRSTSECRVVLNADVPVLHGLMPYRQGWLVTNTCAGELWVLDRDFNLMQRYDFRGLPGKPAEVGDGEWLQHVTPLSDGLFVGLDANRGIIVVDVAAECYEILHPDPSWCIQDLLVIEPTA